jgi:enoyl-CoA hydratase/3-hydroxyacyl-CoA dehydrogenase
MGYQNPLLAAPVRTLPRRVAIVGAGTIGPDVGYYLKAAIPGLELVLIDVVQAAVDRAVARFSEYAAKAVARGKMSEAAAAAVTRGLTGTVDYESLRGCDWVIEAASENLALKQRIFAQVESLIAPEAIITSNTSSLPAQRIFARLEHKQRATVTHFFAPAWRNPVVEVVRAAAADPAVIDYLRWVFCTTGKVPLLTADAPCFMLDRIFDNWCNECGLVLDRATAAEIDSVANEFVHAGPFGVLNMSNGNPIIIETNTLQAEEEGEHYRPAPVFRSVQSWATVPLGKTIPVAPAAAQAVRDRLLGVLFSQTVDILDRGIGSAADLDLGCRLALGFRDGPLAIMRSLGEQRTHEVLAGFVAARPGMPFAQHPIGDYQRFERTLLVDDVGSVKVLTLRRPEALNALHDGVNAEILAVIRRHEQDPAVTGFVITGYGNRAFCAGADIGRFPAMLGDAQASAAYARECSELLLHLDAMHKPVVAALNGMALGGGLELAMRCHGIVALRDAWLQLPEVTLGIVPGIGALVIPFRRWPQAAALFHAMLTRAQRVSAEEARAAGIVDELATDYAGLLQLAVTRVAALAGRPRAALDGARTLAPGVTAGGDGTAAVTLSREIVGIIEAAVREAAAAPTLAQALEIGYRAFGRSACTAAAHEGILAFQQRRQPDFAKSG